MSQRTSQTEEERADKNWLRVRAQTLKEESQL